MEKVSLSELVCIVQVCERSSRNLESWDECNSLTYITLSMVREQLTVALEAYYGNVADDPCLDILFV